jgi:glutamate-1-semialdehyde 2,1-aminomutase
MIPLATRFAEGASKRIQSAELPWSVTQLGCRVEYTFSGKQPRNGGASAATADFELERFLHLHALNRGVLLTPFHNMALMCPATSASDVDLHTAVFAEATSDLLT